MKVAELLEKLSMMPQDAEVMVMVEGQFHVPATRLRWMRSQVTTVKKGGVIEIDPTKGQDEAVIVCAAPEAADGA